MGRIHQIKAQPVGMRKDEALDLSNVNHFKQASLPKKVASQIQAKGLRRVAGNVYVCKSTVEFWKVVDGKLIRLTGTEVDNGEQIAPAPSDNPRGYLADVLNDLTF